MRDLPNAGLRDCQVEAIHGLEESLADDQPRALIQLATGAGKTATSYLASIEIVSARMWFRHLST